LSCSILASRRRLPEAGATFVNGRPSNCWSSNPSRKVQHVNLNRLARNAFRRKDQPRKRKGRVFRAGISHGPISLDLDPERTIEATDKLRETLTDTQKSEVKSVSMDMWQAFMTSASKNVPDAEIVHDKFHIAKYLGEAVDKVRRAENKSLNADGDKRLRELVRCGCTTWRTLTRTAGNN